MPSMHPSRRHDPRSDPSLATAQRIGGELGLTGTLQLGFVVDDMDAACRRIGARLGVGAWYRPRVIKQKLVFDSRPIDVPLIIVVGYVGAVQVELIQRDAGRGSIFEWPSRDAEATPHHFGYVVDSVEAHRMRLAAQGLRAVQHGSIWFAKGHRTRVAYIDARPSLGAIVELIEHRVQGVNIGMPRWYVKLGAAAGLVGRFGMSQHDPRCL